MAAKTKKGVIMFGALIGDLVGSVYEWNNYKAKDFQPFIHPRSFLTDDSVLTVAVADALINERDLVESFKDWGHRYPDSDCPSSTDKATTH
jgi:ADP-ribosyl-[dinitrogen reductase] hydrolase